MKVAAPAVIWIRRGIHARRGAGRQGRVITLAVTKCLADLREVSSNIGSVNTQIVHASEKSASPVFECAVGIQVITRLRHAGMKITVTTGEGLGTVIYAVKGVPRQYSNRLMKIGVFKRTYRSRHHAHCSSRENPDPGP